MNPDSIERRSRDTRPQPAWQDSATPCKAAQSPILLLGLADADLERELRRALPGWTLVPVRSRREARAAVLSGPAPALVLLDADTVGRAAAAALCRRLRLTEARAGSPRAHIELRLRDLSPRAVRAALAAGADEVRPPLPAAALAALIAAKAPPVPEEDPDAADDVRIDPATGEALLAGRPLSLTESEAAALRVLVAWNGKARTRWQLLHDLRGDDAGFVQPRAVDSLVADLRAKLGPAGWRLRTAWGVGYRWDASPRRHGPGRGDPGGRARRRIPLAAAGTLGLVLLAVAAHHVLFRGPPDPQETPSSERGEAAERQGGVLRAETAPSPDPAVLALRAAFALPADTPPAVGIAVRPASDLFSSSAPPPDDCRL